MKPRKLPTQEELEILFSYDKESGNLVRKIPVSPNTKRGDVVGNERSGYLQVKINSVSYTVHRLIYKLVYGDFDESKLVDHIDRNRKNNTIENLRLVDNQTNCRNQGKRLNNTSGKQGVYWFNRQNNWRASIYRHGKKVHLGCFAKKSDAIQARLDAEKELGYSLTHGM